MPLVIFLSYQSDDSIRVMHIPGRKAIMKQSVTVKELNLYPQTAFIIAFSAFAVGIEYMCRTTFQGISVLWRQEYCSSSYHGIMLKRKKLPATSFTSLICREPTNSTWRQTSIQE